jgi:inner membrane protein
MYGTGIFEPFSNYRFQFTTLFIIEPFFTVPLLIAFLALLSLKRDSEKRKFWLKFGLISSLLYLSLTVCNKLYVGKIFSDSMHKQNIHYSDFATAPTPFNTILWNVVAKDTNGLWVGYYSHLDKTKDIKFSFIPYNDSLAGDLINNHVTQQLLLFSEGYYCFTREGDELYVNDLRFGFAGEFDEKGNRFVFSFGLKKDDSAPYGVQIKRNSWSRSRFEGFSKLIERVKGI